MNDVLGPRLPEASLARRHELATKPEAVVLVGERVLLRPYGQADAEELHAISDGRPVTRLGHFVDVYDAEELIWRFMPAGPFSTVEEMSLYQEYVARLPDGRCFVVEDASNGELLGSVSLLAMVSNAARRLAASEQRDDRAVRATTWWPKSGWLRSTVTKRRA